MSRRNIPMTFVSRKMAEEFISSLSYEDKITARDEIIAFMTNTGSKKLYYTRGLGKKLIFRQEVIADGICLLEFDYCIGKSSYIDHNSEAKKLLISLIRDMAGVSSRIASCYHYFSVACKKDPIRYQVYNDWGLPYPRTQAIHDAHELYCRLRALHHVITVAHPEIMVTAKILASHE